MLEYFYPKVQLITVVIFMNKYDDFFVKGTRLKKMVL